VKYVVRVTETCPGGEIVGRMAWLAETEEEMKAMVCACASMAYMGTEVLPVTEPNPLCKEKIAEFMPPESHLRR